MSRRSGRASDPLGQRAFQSPLFSQKWALTPRPPAARGGASKRAGASPGVPLGLGCSSRPAAPREQTFWTSFEPLGQRAIQTPFLSLVVFDPQANTWTELASMGKALANHNSAAIGGKLYVFGGNSPDGTASVEAYDPIAKTPTRGRTCRTSHGCSRRLRGGRALSGPVCRLSRR